MEYCCNVMKAEIELKNIKDNIIRITDITQEYEDIVIGLNYCPFCGTKLPAMEALNDK